MIGQRHSRRPARAKRRRLLHQLQPKGSVLCGCCRKPTRVAHGVSLLYDQDGQLGEVVWWCSRECLIAGQQALIDAGIEKGWEVNL